MNKLLGTLALLVAIAMPAFVQQAGRLSPNDQREFDTYYSYGVNNTRKNDRDDIAKDVKHMQEINGQQSRPMCLMRRSPVRAMNIQPALIKAGCPRMIKASSTRTNG